MEKFVVYLVHHKKALKCYSAKRYDVKINERGNQYERAF